MAGASGWPESARSRPGGGPLAALFWRQWDRKSKNDRTRVRGATNCPGFVLTGATRPQKAFPPSLKLHNTNPIYETRPTYGTSAVELIDVTPVGIGVAPEARATVFGGGVGGRLVDEPFIFLLHFETWPARPYRAAMTAPRTALSPPYRSITIMEAIEAH